MQWTLPTTLDRADPRDEDLVKLARRRDAAAWSEIYSQNHLQIYRYIYGRLGSREEAEDLTAQVFLEALQNIDAYRDMGRPLVAWLIGIARNLVNGGVRKSRRLEKIEASVAEQTEVANVVSIVWGGLSVESVDLAQGLQELTRDQRETLVLRFFVGMTARETAEILGKTEQAVYALQVRAIATLRRILVDEPATPRRMMPA